MTIITAKLSQLRLSPLNVRTVKPASIEAMADDITAHGLLQNLLVYEEDGCFQVFAGGRRLRGLNLLKKRKSITGSFEVAIEVRTKAEAVELSLAENFQRQQMHPADAVRAFVALRDGDNMSASEIAVRFGQVESYVRKLLRLGSLNPDLLDIFAKDGMNLEAAQALTLTENHELQAEAFKRGRGHAHSIRQFLTEEKMLTTSAPFLFVGREAYEAAGGTITADLFSQGSDGYADSPELVNELALTALEALAAASPELAGWQSVNVSVGQPDNLYQLPTLSPAGEREPTSDEAARSSDIEDAVSARITELGEGNHWGDEAIEALKQESRTIKAACRFYTEDQKAIGAVAVFLAHKGQVEFRFYRTKADRKSGIAGSDKLPASLYPASLVDDLSRIKTQAVQEAVARDPALALDVLLDCLAGQLLHGEYAHSLPLKLDVDHAHCEVDDGLMASSTIMRVEAIMAEPFAALPVAGRFETLRLMASEEKMILLAGLVAVMVDGRVSSGTSPSQRHGHIEDIARAGAFEMAEKWQAPIGFFERLRKPAMLTLLRDEISPAAAENCAKMKKGELAVEVTARLTGGAWLPAPLHIGAFDTDEAALDIEEEEMLQDEAA
jgi:ParB family transcriptional regulator, chromosome partitioning protein